MKKLIKLGFLGSEMNMLNMPKKILFSVDLQIFYVEYENHLLNINNFMEWLKNRSNCNMRSKYQFLHEKNVTTYRISKYFNRNTSNVNKALHHPLSQTSINDLELINGEFNNCILNIIKLVKEYGSW